MLRLAVPVILAELGWMAMGIVDTIMVGRLGPEAIAAAGVSNSLQIAFAIFGMGLLLGLDTLVSQAFGARRIDECNRWFWHGAALAALHRAPADCAVARAPAFRSVARLSSACRAARRGLLRVLLWSGVPLLFYAVFRRYLQAIHAVTPVMIALVTANVVNAVGNWVLIYGHAGFPALGLAGSAWATLLARVYLARCCWSRCSGTTRSGSSGLLHSSRTLERARLARLVELGFPAASTVALEVGVFAAATALAGKLDPVSAASHQIALNIAAVAFMVPLGLASAGAVRVGHAVGAGHRGVPRPRAGPRFCSASRS